MRKSTIPALIAVTLLTGATLSVTAVKAAPIPEDKTLLAQGDIDLPGDLPTYSGSEASSSSTPQPSTPNYNRSNNNTPANNPSHNDQPNYGAPNNQGYSGQSGYSAPNNPSYGGQTGYGAPNSNPSYGGQSSYDNSSSVSVPPDISDAPTPYTSSGDGASQQMEIISNSKPLTVEPGPIILPPDFNKRPQIGVLKINEDGSLRQEGIKVDDSQFGKGGTINANPQKLITPAIKSKLTPQQLNTLIQYPGLILSSRHAAQIFNCRHVLLLLPQKANGYEGIDIDLSNLQTRRIYAANKTVESKANSEIIEQAIAGGKLSNVAVIANQDSYKYHRLDANHLSKSSAQKRYQNASEAQQAGLQPCPLCYPEIEYNNYYASGSVNVPDNLPLSENMVLVQRLADVSTQVAYANKLSPQTYRVFLMADSDYKAFSYVGGPILVSDGLLNVMDTPGEIAAIVSHEMAHLMLGHVTLLPQAQQQQLEKDDQSQRKERNKGSRFLGNMMGNVLGSAISYATGSYWAGWGARKVLDIGSKIKITFPKHHEEAADRKAVLMSFKAGYSPQDFVLAINKIGTIYQQRTDNEWLIEHRKTQDRLNNIRGLVGTLSEMEMDLRPWSKDDPTLDAAWRRQAEVYLTHPEVFHNFAQAYKAATGAKTPPSSRK